MPLSSDNSFVMPETSVTVSAVYKVGYVDRAWNGSDVISTVKELPEDKLVDISSVSNNNLSNGNWYIVNGTRTFGSRLRVSGTANIVLCDGATLNANAGIGVSQGATLNIYAQEDGTGILYAEPEHNTSHASIGADSGNAGEINIYGGVITANTETHSRGAGIGGGENGAAGIIRIYGGSVSAYTTNGGAAIGGGDNGQASWYSGEGIIIYGGKINAIASGSGAGIGSGDTHQGSEINISGGAIVAVSESGAGIGAGYNSNAGVINISGGCVWANSSKGGAGIGGGCDGNGGTVNISDGAVFATSALFKYSPEATKAILKAIGDPKVHQDINEAYGAGIGALIMVGIGEIIDLIGSSEKSDAHIDCGMLGLRVIFHALSDCGRGDLAFKMITRDDFPSYGMFVRRGLTSLPENFLPDDRRDNPDSLNHHFFGDIVSWFIQRVAGLRVNPRGLGENDFDISPDFLAALSFAKADYDAPCGHVSVRRDKTETGAVLAVTVPEGASGRIVLPEEYILNTKQNPCDESVRMITLKSGTYEVIRRNA